MKPVKNKIIIKPVQGEIPHGSNWYRCKHCGAIQSGRVNYTQVGGGSAMIVNMNEELGDYDEDNYGGDINIHSYYCTECCREVDSLEELFTDEPEEEEEEEEV